MATKKVKMTTNARLVGDVLPSKRNTFYALKELINNSIKAGAKNIRIDLIPSDCDENSLMYQYRTVFWNNAKKIYNELL